MFPLEIQAIASSQKADLLGAPALEMLLSAVSPSCQETKRAPLVLD